MPPLIKNWVIPSLGYVKKVTIIERHALTELAYVLAHVYHFSGQRTPVHEYQL